MVENWITSPAGRKVIGTFADDRPAWLWSGDGKKLIWCNPAARLRGAKVKKHGLKLAAPMIPIKGQVARLMRLGALGRSSLSRMQFTIGSKPVSATCTCTPLTLEDSTRSLLIVGVDPIDADLMAEYWCAEDVLADIFETDTRFAIYDKDGDLVAGTRKENPVVELPAGPNGEAIAFFEAAKHEKQEAAEDLRVDSELPAEDAPSVDDATVGEDQETPTPDTRIWEAKPDTPAAVSDDSKTKRGNDLSVLLEKLSNDERLFEPLSEIDDEPFTQEVERETAEPEDDKDVDDGAVEAATVDSGRARYRLADANDMPAIEDAAAAADHPQAVDAEQNDVVEVDDGLWQIVGRGFERHLEPQELAEKQENVEPESEQVDEIAAAPDTTKVEQTSRYNFAELSRILNDRIAGEHAEIRNIASKESREETDPAAGELVNLSEESLVLNRLPLGLLIFRDQRVLFVNRAMTDLVGYPDSASLRAQGLEGIFPRHANDDDPFGPVTHLAHRDGGRVPVSARLQAISWQGTPALMLTAKAQTSTQGIEGAVRTFAEQFAAMQGCGYFETSRAGIISSISGRGADLFGRTPQVLIGRPLMLMADHGESSALRAFLEQAARKAETARPNIVLRGIDPRLKIYLFAEGQAGFVTGYFGLVQRSENDLTAVQTTKSDIPTSNIDPAVLTRLSRNVRRPLNTIIGFAELLQSHAFGPIENTRYVEYARDIKLSGHEIVRSVDELEELVRIDSGDYLATPIEFDLAALLDSSISRVRTQASKARVFVRSAISEHLPRIRADEASLGQAILNLLASAIEQTPPGGHVVVSAQREDDGSVAIHVRDSGGASGDIAEKFVVFRDDEGVREASAGSQGSSVGLALTRSLLAINTCTLAIEAGAGQSTVLSLFIPAELAADPAN